jgi:hypothetical protein
MRDDRVPDYEALLRRTDAPPGSSWNVFGEGDQLGALNFLTPQRIVEAAQLIKRGAVFNLDYHLNAFMPNLSPSRSPMQHHIFSNNPNHRDDWIDSFYLQSTTQIDGLRHIRDPQHGFYGGVPDERIVEGERDLGISLAAEHGIVGRGVLIDAARYYAAQGQPLDPWELHRITPHDMDAIAAAQGVSYRSGDILLLRCGWTEFYTALSPEERAALPNYTMPTEEQRKERPRIGCPGLDQSREMLAWIWDHQFSLIASDNPGVECYPVNPDSGHVDSAEGQPKRGMNQNGMIHRPLIALLGLLLGELWALDELAADCAADGVYEFFLCSKPLNLIGGVGSPANAVAIK